MCSKKNDIKNIKLKNTHFSNLNNCLKVKYNYNGDKLDLAKLNKEHRKSLYINIK
ncbi:hypothetical protein AAJ76_1890003945 [Vairimorpha ceranae]|uniref:Uncharacterized protein n=1 Tax=Vairimorpha ceranae TaxID=40302 RepID=A0A0F9W822_9MICR|nr:hypothetical protein AAJ76_1890003945 [Vairimorpha ceranae]KKO73881.1 hypothetical protein AAJ76_1890003945 [Vairimorpha ceranae]